MLSEFCREAAVLVFVFGNLDIWLKSFTGELDKLSLGWWAITSHVMAVFGFTIFLCWIGFKFESWRAK
jgi:hypothetical protein